MIVDHAIPKLWAETLNEDSGNSVNFEIYDQNLIKGCHICTLDRFVIKELYNFIKVWKNYININYINLQKKLLWKATWTKKFELTRNITFTKKRFNRFKCLFQYKLLCNILILNKLVFKLKKDLSLLRSFCKYGDKLPLQIPYTCNVSILILEIYTYRAITEQTWNYFTECLLQFLWNTNTKYFINQPFM